MKDKFGILKKKILLQVIMIAVIGFSIVLIVQFFLRNGATPYIMWSGDVLPDRLDVPTAQLQEFSEIMYRAQIAFVVTVGLLVLLVIVFYFSLMRMTKYFQETSDGVDQLLDKTSGEITLSRELDFMAEKLNSVKDALEKQEHDARDAERRKNDLVVYLAHDIRTPLTTVIGYLNLLDETPDMPAEERIKYIDITLGNALRLEELVNEFFEITRFNAQDIHLDLHEINLSHMLNQMADEFYPMLIPQGKKMTVETDKGLVVCGDADKLARVFRNILKNAVVFSDDHSTIRIKAERQKDEVKITFRNTGTLIPQTELEAIFDKFYRLDESRSSKTGGAGLGLAIAKKIVVAHDGRIYAENKGEETVFTVFLPGK